MPTYRIRCGDMDHKIKTPYPADASVLACIALNECRPKQVGILIEISGGEYRGRDKTYVSTEKTIQLIGRWKG